MICECPNCSRFQPAAPGKECLNVQLKCSCGKIVPHDEKRGTDGQLLDATKPPAPAPKSCSACGMTLIWPLEKERHKCPTHATAAKLGEACDCSHSWDYPDCRCACHKSEEACDCNPNCRETKSGEAGKCHHDPQRNHKCWKQPAEDVEKFYGDFEAGKIAAEDAVDQLDSKVEGMINQALVNDGFVKLQPDELRGLIKLARTSRSRGL